MRITDSQIKLSTRTSPAGKVIFLVRNTGRRTHNFRIAGRTTKPIKRGRTARLLITFKVVKAYAFLSTLPHGNTKGLSGVFKVTKPGASLPGNPKAGKAVFASAGCRGCHALKAAAATGGVGPNLDKAKPSYARTVERVTSGKGLMPAFKSTLTVAQIRNVAAFVYEATHG